MNKILCSLKACKRDKMDTQVHSAFSSQGLHGTQLKFYPSYHGLQVHTQDGLWGSGSCLERMACML